MPPERDATNGAALLALGPASRLVGVDPDTLRRWADDGRVEVSITPGGHRRFHRRSLERLLRAGTDERATLARLGGTPQRLTAAYRRTYRTTRTSAPDPVRAVPEDDRAAWRDSGRELVASLVRHLDAEIGGRPGDRARRGLEPGRDAGRAPGGVGQQPDGVRRAVRGRTPAVPRGAGHARPATRPGRPAAGQPVRCRLRCARPLPAAVHRGSPLGDLTACHPSGTRPPIGRPTTQRKEPVRPFPPPGSPARRAPSTRSEESPLQSRSPRLVRPPRRAGHRPRPSRSARPPCWPRARPPRRRPHASPSPSRTPTATPSRSPTAPASSRSVASSPRPRTRSAPATRSWASTRRATTRRMCTRSARRSPTTASCPRSRCSRSPRRSSWAPRRSARRRSCSSCATPA